MTVGPDQTEALLDDPVKVEVKPDGSADVLVNSGRNTERIVFFSDAVMAIALTLLVLDIRLPEGVADRDLTQAVIELGPRLLGFAVSFMLIVGTWSTHFRRFRAMTGYNRRVIQINFVLLFLVCLLPFPTAVFAEHAPTSLATAMYGGSVGAIFLVQAIAWIHARHEGLLAPVVNASYYRLTRDSLIALGLVFASAVPLAYVRPALAWGVWLVLGPTTSLILKWYYRNRDSRRRTQAAPPIDRPAAR